MYSSSDGTTTWTTSQERLSILLVTFPSGSHLVPMAALGEELVTRGHNVTLYTIVEDDSAMHVHLVKRSGINLFNAGRDELDTEIANRTFIETFFSLLDGDPFLRLMAHYSKLLDNTNISMFDTVVIDVHLSPMMVCISKKWQVKVVSLSVGLSLNSPISSWLGPALGTEFHQLITAICRPILGILFCSVHNAALPSELQCSASENYVFEPSGHHFPHLIVTMIGVELGRPKLPLVEYIGPLLSKNPEPLPQKLEYWLGAKSTLSVIYFNMDSINYMSADQAQNILQGALATNNSVVWSLNAKKGNILKGMNIDSEKVYVTDWIPQLSLLQHSSIGAAIFHGSLDGIQASLSSGVPLLIIPSSKDQENSMAPIVRQQLGASIPLSRLSTEAVAKAITLIKLSPYRANMGRLQSLYQWTGGVERAAFLIEVYGYHGYEHLIPAYIRYNWNGIQYHNIDVDLILLAMVMLTAYCTIRCCACGHLYMYRYLSCSSSRSKLKAD